MGSNELPMSICLLVVPDILWKKLERSYQNNLEMILCDELPAFWQTMQTNIHNCLKALSKSFRFDKVPPTRRPAWLLSNQQPNLSGQSR
eukprot:6261627-Amphidinium_carterae.1